MGWLKSLFGSRDTANKVIDLTGDAIKGVGSWIDGKDFTAQEKAEQWSKAVDAHLKLIEATTNENSLRSVTRRWLAWAVTGYMLFWGSIAMVYAIRGEKEAVASIISVMEALSLGYVFLAIMGFYFGVQLLRK